MFSSDRILIISGNQKFVKMLIEAGANVNHTDVFDDTPLHKASEFGFEKVAKMLISAGANVNAVNWQFESPLHIAAANGQDKLVALLLANGADKNLTNFMTFTAYDFAKEKGTQ